MDIDALTIGSGQCNELAGAKVLGQHRCVDLSCNLACLCVFSYNARDLKTTPANYDPGVQDCLLISFHAIPDLTIELMPRLRRVLTGRITHLLDSGPSALK